MHIFLDASNPQYPIVLPLDKTYAVTRTEVERISTGNTTSEDEYLFTHYVWVKEADDGEA